MLQHARFTFACRPERHAERTPVVTAPMPAQALTGSNASAAMIATVLPANMSTGTPLYRMSSAGTRGYRDRAWHLANWISLDKLGAHRTFIL